MPTTQLAEVLHRRSRMAEDKDATTATKDALAKQYHGKNVSATGTVVDVEESDGLAVTLNFDGLELVCPLIRTTGGYIEKTEKEVRSWRKGMRVEVDGKLEWTRFDSDLSITILNAHLEDLGI